MLSAAYAWISFVVVSSSRNPVSCWPRALTGGYGWAYESLGRKAVRSIPCLVVVGCSRTLELGAWLRVGPRSAQSMESQDGVFEGPVTSKGEQWSVREVVA